MAITFPVRDSLNMQDRQINNVATPTMPNDAATMQYVMDNAGSADTFLQTHTVATGDTLTNFVLTLTNVPDDFTFTDANTVVEHNGIALNSDDFTITNTPNQTITITGLVAVGDCITVRTAETAGTTPPPTPGNTAFASGTTLPTTGDMGEHFDLTAAQGSLAPGIYRRTGSDASTTSWTLVATRNADALQNILSIADNLINTTPADYNGNAAGGMDGVNAGFGGLRINPDNTGGMTGTIEVDTDNIPVDALGNVGPAWTPSNVNGRAPGSVLRWVNTVGQDGLSQDAFDKWGGIWAVSPNVGNARPFDPGVRYNVGDFVIDPATGGTALWRALGTINPGDVSAGTFPNNTTGTARFVAVSASLDTNPFTGLIGTTVPDNLQDGGLYYKNVDGNVTHMIRGEQTGEYSSQLRIGVNDIRIAHVNGGGNPPATDNGFYDFETGPSTNRVNRAADTGLGIEFNPVNASDLLTARYNRSQLATLFGVPNVSNFLATGLLDTNGNRVFVRFLNGTTPIDRRYMLVGIGRRINNDGNTLTTPEQGFTEWREVDEDGNVMPSPPPLGNGVPLSIEWRVEREIRPELTARSQTLSGVGPLLYTMSSNTFTAPARAAATTPA